MNNTHKELRGLFKKQKNTNVWDEINATNFYAVVEKFYDTVINGIPEYKSYFIDDDLTLKKARLQNKYLLFRPVGLKLLAKLYNFFMKKYNNDASVFLEKVNKISFIMPKSPLNKVLWNDGVMDVGSGNQPFAYKLCLYLLGEIEDDNSDIIEKYRKITKDNSASLPKRVVQV